METARHKGGPFAFFVLLPVIIAAGEPVPQMHHLHWFVQEVSDRMLSSLLHTECARDKFYKAKDWSTDLTAYERGAWTELGWDATTWSAIYPGAGPNVTMAMYNSTPVPGTNTTLPAPNRACYGDLTKEQQDALKVLGYDIQLWHDCRDVDELCEWPAGFPEAGASCKERLDFLDARWNTPWALLTPLKRENYEKLYFDEERWTNRDFPEIFAKPWAELTSTENTAATFLDYDNETWHSNRCKDKIDCLTRHTRLKNLHDYYEWQQLGPVYRSWFSELGWNMQRWTDYEKPMTSYSKWRELGDDQRKAAILIGYHEDTWEACPDSPCVERYAKFSFEAHLRNTNWQDMRTAIRRSWIILGWTESTWALKEVPSLFSLRWDELTPEQKAAAEYLMLDMDSWHGCAQQQENATLPTTNDTERDPLREVRAQMTIRRPFSDISGNVYGQSNTVSRLPASFVVIFERSISRALFCDNPPTVVPNETEMMLNPPECLRPEQFDAQQHRIQTIIVQEGSIIVQFVIQQNETADQRTAVECFDSLQRQLDSTQSPLMNDKEFYRFAKVATLIEVIPTDGAVADTNEIREMEDVRGPWTEKTACKLRYDRKSGYDPCVSMAWRPPAVGAALVLVSLALAGAPAPGPS